MHLRLALALAALLLTGCPGDAGSAATPSLVLRTDGASDGAVAAAVGSSAALRLTMPPAADGAQLFGALLANEPARLTRWHAEPAEGIVFEASAARFERPGSYRVWATWTDAAGRELTSNELRFEVR